jgi:signal transduction histidine kinase
MLRRLSVRARIVIGSTSVAVALIAVACVAVYAQVSAMAVAREKAVLHGIAEVYRGVIEQDPTEPFERPGVDQHVAIIAPAGTLRMNTLPRSLAGRTDELTSPGPALREVGRGGGYYVYRDVVSTPDGPWTVLVARDRDIAAAVVSEVVGLLWTVLIGNAVLFATGSWIVATIALRPVERLRRSAERLALSPRQADAERLPVRGSHDEIDTLAGTLNRLIAAVHAAARREQQMIADASHELRNPLTVLRAQLELIDGSDAGADDELLRAARATLNRLILLAQSILELSRIEADPETARTPVHDLRAAVAERVDHVRRQLAEPSTPLRGEVTLAMHIDDPDARAAITAEQLDRVVDNLIDNALHSRPGGPVHVHVLLRASSQELTLLVSDDGPGVDETVIDRAFERVSRGEASRYAGGGLGLAIVSRIAERGGGSTSLRSDLDGAEVGIRLPLTPGGVAGRSPNTHQR